MWANGEVLLYIYTRRNLGVNDRGVMDAGERNVHIGKYCWKDVNGINGSCYTKLKYMQKEYFKQTYFSIYGGLNMYLEKEG